MKKLVIITAHPDKKSLCFADADALEKSAKTQKLEVKRYNAFDFPLISQSPIPHGFPAEYDAPSSALAEADFVAVVCPMWNFGVPGALKNFLDGVIQARKLFSFQPVPLMHTLSECPGMRCVVPEAKPVGLMKAQKVLCVWTADGPAWYYRLLPWKNVLFRQVKAIFKYCGVRKCRQKILGMTRKTTDEERAQWLKDLENYQF